MNFSIVIPLYNEEKNIYKLFEEILTSCKNNNFDKFEIIFIDDASTDKTYQKIEELKNLNKFKITIIKNKNNLGQSLSIVNGIKASSFENIITIDGDGQNNPNDIPRLINKFKSMKSVEMIGGIRTKRIDNKIKKISSKIANKFRMIILQDGCIDTGCSLKIFKKETFLKFPIFNGMHRFLPALFRAYNKEIDFIHVDHRKRLYGVSNYGTFDRLFKGINDTYRVWKIIKQNRK